MSSDSSERPPLFWVNAWADLVFHVLAHVRGTAHLAASVYDPEYVAFCETSLGPAAARTLGEDADVLAGALGTHPLLAQAQLLAWLFDSPERAASTVDRDLAQLAPADVDRPALLAPLVALGGPAELLRAAAGLEEPAHARLPAPALELERLATQLRALHAVAPRLARGKVGVARALGLRGRVLGDEIWVGRAPSVEHMAWQAAHEATVAEVAEADPRALHDEVEREAIARLGARAARAGMAEAHAAWLAHLKLG